MITNFDKVSVGNRSGFGITVNAQNDNSAESGTFADSLKAEKPSTVKVPCAPPDVESNVEIPERWGSEEKWGYAFVLKDTLDYLNNELGVDTSKRTPTHTITDEQREWLASRHDLEALKNSTGDTPELAQLFGDLVFLNVMSASDVCYTMVPIPPMPEGQTSQLTYLGDFDNFPEDTDLLLERIKKYIEMHRNVFELNKSEWSTDYLNEFCDFMKSLDESHKVLFDLFRPAAKEDETAELGVKRNITDASEQFRSDFGTLLA